MQSGPSRLAGLRIVAVAAVCLLGGTLTTAKPVRAQGRTDTTAAAAQPFVVEYYYRVRWGRQEEFWQLFRKNHLPILEAEQRLGIIRTIRIDRPREHLPEEARWDYRVTLVFHSVAAYVGPELPAADRHRMYPDTAAFTREERRRFELLLAHWDVPVMPVARDP